MRKEKAISTDNWWKKYQEEFIQKHKEEQTNLDLFHFTVDKINRFRMRLLWNSGLSSFNKAHTKIMNKINKEFEDYVNDRLSEILTIKKSGETNRKK